MRRTFCPHATIMETCSLSSAKIIKIGVTTNLTQYFFSFESALRISLRKCSIISDKLLSHNSRPEGLLIIRLY